MKDLLYVVKVGGNILEDDEKLSSFLEAFSQMASNRILIHGGGRSATHLAKKLGRDPVMIEGRRITDSAMLEIVIMAYGGQLNKKIVSGLQGRHINAIGLTGADGNLILAKKRPKAGDIDFGWVGDPVQVNNRLLQTLLEGNMIPVVAPLTHDGLGHMLNTNADTLASVIGSALQTAYEVHVVYAFELMGVLRKVDDPDSLIREMDRPQFEQMKKTGEIVDGMIPKLDNAFEALDSGVRSVRIVHYEALKHIHKEDYHDYTLIK